MQNIILFMDASGRDYETSQKSGNSFMNRVAIDEDAAFEIIGIHYLETQQSFNKPYGGGFSNSYAQKQERRRKMSAKRFRLVRYL